MDIGDRMKGYEKVWDQKLPRRVPVLARIDGVSFSKLTERYKFKKPYDQDFIKAMYCAMRNVVTNVSGVVLAYHQSDEITVLLKNNQTFETEPYAANRIQKLTSHLAALATCGFNKELGGGGDKPAFFDCRVWTVPEAEINNSFLWRQQDAFRNCVQAVAHYGLKEKLNLKGRAVQKLMANKSTNELQELIFKELWINIDTYPTHLKRGTCMVKKSYLEDRAHWVIDENIPIFSKDPGYIEDQYFSTEEELDNKQRTQTGLSLEELESIEHEVLIEDEALPDEH